MKGNAKELTLCYLSQPHLQQRLLAYRDSGGDLLYSEASMFALCRDPTDGLQTVTNY